MRGAFSGARTLPPLRTMAFAQLVTLPTTVLAILVSRQAARPSSSLGFFSSLVFFGAARTRRSWCLSGRFKRCERGRKTVPREFAPPERDGQRRDVTHVHARMSRSAAGFDGAQRCRFSPGAAVRPSSSPSKCGARKSEPACQRGAKKRCFDRKTLPAVRGEKAGRKTIDQSNDVTRREDGLSTNHIS